MALEFNFGNLFGGDTTTGLNALLNADQRRLMNQQGNLSAAAALLQASGPSRQRVGLGQALGAALQAGQQGYQQARAGSLQDLLLGEKLKDAQLERDRKAAYANIFGGGGQAGPSSAEASLAAPVETAGPVGPTVARAALMNAAPPTQQGGPLSFLSPTQRALLSGMKPDQGLPEILRLSQASEEYGAPTPVVMNGQTVMVQYNKMGQPRIAQGAMPYEAQSADVRAVEYLRGTPLAGTGQTGVKAVGEYRQQIAPKTTTNVDVKMPGNQQFLAGVGTNIAETLSNLTAGATAANSTLANVERILPALDKAVLGPGADYRTTLLRIGQQLGVAGANANDTLAQTATVVQGLAQAELDAAAQMKGQGTLTDAERAILRRAAGGDQSLTAVEIQTGLNAAKKNANARLKLQADYVQRASKLPGFEQFAPMYQVTPYTGGNNPLLNLIDQSLQQRQPGARR
jgi:hypothetical protein